MPSLIRLNALDYVVKGPIQRYSQTPFAEVFRTIGLQRREDIQTSTGFVFGVPIYGFGRRRLTKIDDARQILQMWDSQVMTHFESQVGLAPLRVADTGELAIIRGSAVFKGSLWGLWSDNTGASNRLVAAVELTSATDTTWAGGGTVDGAAATADQGAFDLTVHKDRLVALWWDTQSHNIAHSTDGITWTQAVTDITATLLNAGLAGETDFDGGLLATVGNELVAVVYSQTAGLIRFYSSTDSGATMVDEGSLMPSNSGVKGLVVYPGIDGATKLLVGTENGVYEVDTAPATWTATPIIPIRYHVDNCVLPGNTVSGYGIRDASRVWYEGPALKLQTKGGRTLTVTPKHPVLTDGGWRFAQDLRPGDKLVCTSGDEGVVPSDKYVTDIPPTIEQVFSTLDEVRGPDRRRMSHPARVFDFHGDGRFMDGDVDVVGANRKLWCTCRTSGREPIHEQGLCGSDVQSHSLACERTLGKVFTASPMPTDGSVHSPSSPLFFLQRSPLHPLTDGGTERTRGDIALLETSTDDDAADSHSDGDSLHGLPTAVEFDDLISVDEFKFVGHVYDLQTVAGLYNASGVIVHNCRRMTVHQGAAWIPVGANSGEPAGMIRYTVNGDTRLIEYSVGVNGEALGLDAFDGVPSDKLGPFNWLKSTGKYLLAAVGGTAASRNGHLLLHNGLGWHYLARNATANQKLYWVDDLNGTPHYANRTATTPDASTTDTLGVQNALVNPASGLAITRETSGILVRPEFDGGMPRYNAAWLEVYYDAVNLGTTSQEYIAIAYGLNGAAASTTSLGNIVDGDLDLPFGTGGIGVSARSIQIQETYNRDAAVTTDTPTGRSLELTYLKVIPTLEAWAFVIDLAETARFTSGGMETVLTNLATARDSVPKVSFVYGRMTSANVKVVPPLRFEEELEEEGTIANAARTGTVQVIVREVN